MHLTCSTPYDWQRLLRFFAGRATPGVESVDGDSYRRTLLIGGKPRVFEIGPGRTRNGLRFDCYGISSEQSCQLAAAVTTVFDVDAPIRKIRRALAADPALAAMLGEHRGVRVPGAFDGFELTIRAILGQQISVKAATTIAGRIADRYGEPFESGHPGLDRLFPTPARLARVRFNRMGLVQSRIDTIRRVAAATRDGTLRFDGSQDVGELRKALLAIKGIGDWTTEYVCMRAMKDADAFPASDLGLLSAIAPPARISPRELRARAEPWRPWRAYAAMLLWGSLPGAGG